MKKFSFSGLAACAFIAAPAMAQTTPPTPAPTPAPTQSPSPMPSQSPSTQSMQSPAPINMTDAQALQWVDKIVYSSDGKNVGEVASFQRDSKGNVTELYADIGGFLGLGETRVRATPAQFHIDGDRVVLHVTADQAKSLPQVKK